MLAGWQVTSAGGRPEECGVGAPVGWLDVDGGCLEVAAGCLEVAAGCLEVAGRCLEVVWRLLDVVWRLLDVVWRLLDVVCRLLDVVCRLLDVVCRLLDVVWLAWGVQCSTPIVLRGGRTGVQYIPWSPLAFLTGVRRGIGSVRLLPFLFPLQMSGPCPIKICVELLWGPGLVWALLPLPRLNGLVPRL